MLLLGSLVCIFLYSRGLGNFSQVLISAAKAVFMVIVTVCFFYAFKIYQFLWEYADTKEYLSIIISTVISSAFLFLVNLIPVFRLPNLSIWYFSVFALHYMIFSKWIYRCAVIKRRHSDKKNPSIPNVMIIGAGEAGAMILREYQAYPDMGHPVIFIDDDEAKKGKSVSGVKIYGTRNDIQEAVIRFNIRQIVIAIPSAKKSDMRDIVKICRRTGCHIKAVPGIYQIIDDTVKVSQLREVDILALLGRDQVNVDYAKMFEYIKGQTILVTGGGGSIGSELCRQILVMQPKKLLILDIYENNAYDLLMELQKTYPEADVEVIIASVRDEKRMDSIFDKYRPETVFHAAAHKHVPLMENNAPEAIKNNVFGTLNTIRCADKYKAKRFVLISTDKAVNPTNVMGASKRIAELIIQSYAKKSCTKFSAVRFGNVLGSNGSVVPLFYKQIAAGGPVTVTHPDITRYFMTIPEAVALVLQAGSIANGGEVFVLDMGEPVKITDLAREMIRLSGFEPDTDIQILYTGLRPGEKLYEELLLSEADKIDFSGTDKIYIDKPPEMQEDELESSLARLKELAASNDIKEIIKYMHEMLPSYSYAPHDREDCTF